MHKVADAVEEASGLRVLHIADATAAAVAAQGLSRVGLLATAFTMEDTFYVDRLARHGLEAVVPDRGRPGRGAPDHLRRAGARRRTAGVA